MAIPAYNLDREQSHPYIHTLDTTSYPALPSAHALSRTQLYKLVVEDVVTGTELSFSSVSGVATLLDEPSVGGGIIYDIEVPDGLHLFTFYLCVEAVVGVTYDVDECVVYGTSLYKCTTGGVLDNADPTLSTGALFSALASEADLTSDYIVSYYAVAIFDYAAEYKNILYKSVITNQDVCPKLGNDCDFMDAMKYHALFVAGGLINPTVAYLAAASNRLKVTNSLSKLSLICND